MLVIEGFAKADDFSSVYLGNVGVQSHYGRGRCFQLTEEIASASFQGRNLVLYGGTGNARFESCDQPTNLAFGLFQIAGGALAAHIIYDGIRLTPAQIVEAAQSQNAHVVGLSILSGSHLALVQDVVARLRSAGLGHIPVVVGGIIPPEDAQKLKQLGIAAVYTPKDFDLNSVMADVLRIVDAAAENAH